jgi:hypothetical protein
MGNGQAAHLPELLNRLAWRLQEGEGQISLVRSGRNTLVKA